MLLKTTTFENSLDMIPILENITEACLYVNSDWKIEFLNKAAEPYFKTSPIGKSNNDLIGMNVWEALPKYIGTDFYKNCLKIFDEQKSQVFEILDEYSKVWLEIKVFPIENGLFVMFCDISDRKESEKEREYFDKIKAIGEMAAGVAHEVRNPMTTVKGFLQLMAQNQELEEYKSVNLLMINEIDRINNIITQFLNIAQDKSTNLQFCNLNKLITDYLPLLETRSLKEGKSIVLELNNIPFLKIDQNEIRQVLLNLINNSLDAMVSGQTVRVTTSRENNKIVLSIKDEGHGIPSAVIDSVVTPFVTTKDDGTGLGLPICFSIAKRNNAKIDFTSSPEGTTFNIRFSLVD
ncbi:nitrogen regulation protein NR(II) [Paenisporosarcina sp. TG20]|uniref:two-component system sensor histidine kinase NtrB n=1 Tax=Paenisporosarcina sp. TG20 TaxID=1211706 RepID=UPI0002E1CD25|nr:ATP-binding protein [Paenisporosarcina sp. TG20]